MDKKLQYSRHALERMFEREISPEDVEKCLEQGMVIEEYPNDYPYPSNLLLDFKGDLPIHIVTGEDTENSILYIVTVYIPDRELWRDDFKKRRNE